MEAKKRLYIGLLVISLIVVLTLLVGFWWLLYSDWLAVQRKLLVIIGLGLTLLFSACCLGISAIIFILWSQKPITFLEKYIRIVLTLFSPLIIKVGQMLDLKKEKIEDSFIEVNNQLVKAKKMPLNPEQILLLLPHCLQKASCPRKITIDIHNCQHCGGCPIGDLIELAASYPTNLAIVTGGTAARRRLTEVRPKAIVAVACERDLMSGIQDAYPLPVLGVLNERPEGPCYNTSVDLNKVKESIEYLLKRDKEIVNGK